MTLGFQGRFVAMPITIRPSPNKCRPEQEFGQVTPGDVQGRVERWRGDVKFRFHLPLIEPDGRISRIRLSDKGFQMGFSCLRTRGDVVCLGKCTNPSS
jgi:hypothetical protein